MSSVQLTHFDCAEYRPSKKLTRCKNCWAWTDEEMRGTIINPGQPRIVINGGWGPSTRNLTLCPSCAEGEAERLEALAIQIRRAVSEVP